MRYLGIDLGVKNTGISISDFSGTIASPLIMIKTNEKIIEELLNIIKEKNIEFIVVGLPKNMNNSLGESAERTLNFINKLKQETDIPIDIIDERLTTKEAENILITANLSRKKRKEVIDKTAAVIILQSYLNQKRKEELK